MYQSQLSLLITNLFSNFFDMVVVESLGLLLGTEASTKVISPHCFKYVYSTFKIQPVLVANELLCCLFWPAFRCCAYPKAGQKTFLAVFNLFCWFFTRKQIAWKLPKQYFHQLLGACSTQKLVKIHNMCSMGAVFRVLFCSVY